EEVLGPPQEYSLLERDAQARTFSLHHLVQEVTQAALEEAKRRGWAERAVRAVNRAFPPVEVQYWPWCERLVAHALACAQWIERQELAFAEAARLLNQAGSYLCQRGQYAAAERLYKRALAIREEVLGPKGPDTARSLNNLAELYRSQGKLTEAEPLL